MLIWPESNTEFVSGVIAPESIEKAWYFAFSHGEILQRVDQDGNFQPLGQGDQALIERLHSKKHFMGTHRDIACFAVEVDRTDEFEFSGLRSLFGKTDNMMLALAGRAQQICEWFRTHQYCGKCGQATIEHDNDRAMVCESCRIHSYPRLSPSIIVLVHRGREVLLARNHRFPDGMYSTLAGFVEPGESIEETLIREVKEEVGVLVKNLEYLGSQPWPFPNSLMLGFHAEYDSGDILLQEEEIADAKWFSIDDLPAIPGKIAISRWLIDDFLSKQGPLKGSEH
jgi:NAD+ diphosphatase